MKAQDLKNSILQLAIQGKLVPQDTSDEPAEVLYAKIKAEKQKLIKEGKIKKDKHLPPITDDEVPFSIPPSWKWVRLSDIVYSVPTKEYQILQSEISDNGKYPVVSQSQQLIEGYSNKVEKLYKHEKPVLIFGDHTRCLKLIDFNFVVGADGVKILYPFGLDEKYLYYAIQYFIINMTNRGYSRHFQFIKDKEIPLPPLAEQKRIVAKIEELEPLVKQYDKAETELSTLNESFPEQLKKSILQWAIQGRLVLQDTNDETADILYAKIQAEKQKLIKEGKIKKDKPLPPITDDEIPFSIPPSWVWVRLGDIGESRIGLTYHPEDISDDGMIVLRSSNIQNNKLSFNDIVRVKTSVPNNLLVNTGDIIICARNGSKALVGKSAIIQDMKEPMTFGAFMAIYKSPINEYVKIYLDSPLFKKTLDAVNTVTINQITQKNLNNAIIPLPPLAEQKLIVAKVNELMQYCEKLNSKR